MTSYILGIDGGGTKSQCALFTAQGEKVDFLDWGTTNHESLKGGMSVLPMELKVFTETILHRNNLVASDIEYSVFGLAGVDTRAQHRQISKIFFDLGFKDFLLCNDSYLGIKGGVPKGYGICVINGTGCTVTGINSKGSMLQIGGQGILTGDRGGAGSIGGMAVAAAYNQLFKSGPVTIITDIMFSQLKIIDKYSFLEALTDKLDSDYLSLAELNRVVFEAARLGDNTACQILREVGEDIGNCVNGIIAELFSGDKHIDVVLAGSLNVKEKCRTIEEALISRVKEKNPLIKVEYSVLREPPVFGAVIWALSKAGTGTCTFEKVRSQF